MSAAFRVPDLYRSHPREEATKLYTILMARLPPDEAVEVKLRQPAEAWRTYLAMNRAFEPQPVFDALTRPGLLYLNGRFEDARRALERYLRPQVIQGHDLGALIFHLVNEDVAPDHTARVTLSHIYAALDRPLSRWREWPLFTARFDPRLLALAGLTAATLEAEPARLFELYSAMRTERRRRAPGSVVTFGTRDLTDPEPAVQARHAEAARRIALGERGMASLDERLRAAFPFLR